MRTETFATALTAVIGALLAGCASTHAGATAPPPLDGTAWVLASLPAGASTRESTATLSFEGGRAAGSDGCNRFTAAYTTRGSEIEIGARGASTMMACAPDVMQRAEAFMTALGAARSFRVADANLQLLGGDGALLATLKPQSRSLTGTWNVNGINNGRNAVVSLVSGTSVTMVFSEDGKVAGSAGCNAYTARYDAKGSRLRFSAPGATRKACPADGVMEQEDSFLKALEAVTTMRIDGDRLELRDDAGALQVGAVRAR
jgi:heat shock protein HslJ